MNNAYMSGFELGYRVSQWRTYYSAMVCVPTVFRNDDIEYRSGYTDGCYARLERNRTIVSNEVYT